MANLNTTDDKVRATTCPKMSENSPSASRVFWMHTLVFFLMAWGLGTVSVFGQAFDQENLDFNGNPGVNNATSLEFGPDGKLYVAEENGLVKVYTIKRNGPADYEVSDAEVLTLVQSIPNHDDDDGELGGPGNRQVTGITVGGTAADPVVYVSSSDRRRGAGGGGGDVNLDTNSGVITRLVKNGDNWQAVDIVRGLPRSEENHATNGMQLVTISGTDWLLVSSGGFTNAGSPSNNFAYITEYALSGAVLAIDLDAIEALPIQNDGSRSYIYDLPTLDDPTRDNVNGVTDPDDPNYDGVDINDPWGGNDGLNMAMLVPNSPVKMFSSGYRNSYDLIVTADRHIYVTDNGANGGWGGFPEFEGNPDLVNNNWRFGEPGSNGPDAAPNSSPFDPQVNNKDHLNLVATNIDAYEFGSVYGGHPCPVRANANAGLFTRGPHSAGGAGQAFSDSYFRTKIYDPDGSRADSESDPQKALPANWPPVHTSLLNPDDADFRQPTTVPGVNPEGTDDIIVFTWGNNTNGIVEYTASNFGGIMKGDLIAGKGGALHRVDRDPNNGSILGLEQEKFSVSGNALGVDALGDDEVFPGTIWVANYNGNDVVILEPNDFVVCVLPGQDGYNPLGDNDADGYSNDDEFRNGTDMCSGASRPTDFDGDEVSDLLDTDDDGDGIADDLDPLQLGIALDLPVENELFLGTDLGGYLGLGFTGLMNNGDPNPNYQDWQDDPRASETDTDDILGGAIGAVTMFQTTGDALNNTQEKAYQYGINIDDESGIFTVHGRMFPPFHNFSATESQGMFIGDGFQDDYVKLVLGQNYELSVVGEDGGSFVTYVPSTPIGFSPTATTNNLDLLLVINSATGSVRAQYAIDDGPVTDVGSPFTLQGKVLADLQSESEILVVGILGTADTEDAYGANWDFLNVAGSLPFVVQQLPNLERTVGAASDVIGLDSYFADDGGVENLVFEVTGNTDERIGTSISGNNLTLTYPNETVTAAITVQATDADSFSVEQTFEVVVNDSPSVLFRVNAGDVLIAATDALNPDWAANIGTGAQSGTDFSVNTGNISTHNTTGRHASVPEYAPQALFAKERWDPGAAPEMEWSFNTGNGNFTVNLYMANGFAGTSEPGTRIFDVNMEGVLTIDDKDLSGQYGSGVGVMESYQVTVTDGVLNIEFIHQTENPLINAIEILGNSGVVNTPITLEPIANQSNSLGDTPVLFVIASGGDDNETFTYEAVGLPPGLSIEPTNGSILGTIPTDPLDAGNYTVEITVSKPSSSPITDTFVWNISDPNVSEDVAYRINAGGALTLSNDGISVNWGEDQAASGAAGTASNGAPSAYVNATAEDKTFGAILPGTFENSTGYPNSLFATERFNTNPVPNNMQWDFPVENGTYTINLIFAEIWADAQTAGTRVFDVAIEGNTVLDDFDQTAAYGWAVAGVESFTIDISDGNLDIDFVPGVQNPNIKAIEIIAQEAPVADIWTAITNTNEHEPRHENSFVQLGDKFYLFGGRESAEVIEVYDYQTNTWSDDTAPAPFEFNHFQAVAYEGLIWVIGSFKDNGYPNETPADFIYMYDPLADVWIQGPAIPEGRKRGSAGLVMFNDKFYVIAGNTDGHNGGYIPWFDEFDPATGTWTALADAPHSRDHFHATVVGNALYVAGGRLSGGTGGVFAPVIPEVDVYDFASSSWSTLPEGSNLPNARAASATVNFQGRVVVLGGEGNGQAYPNTDALDVNTGTWTALSDLNNARHGTQAIVSGDGIWITSGSPNQGGGSQTNMEVYGTDNPTGTAVAAGTLSVPNSLTVNTGEMQILTLENSGGNQGTYVSSISITGVNAANFEIVGNTGFLVPSDGNNTIEVVHTGTMPDDTATLQLIYGNGQAASAALTSSGDFDFPVLYRVNAGGAVTIAEDAPKPDWTVDTLAEQSVYLTGLGATGNSVFAQTAGSAYKGDIDMTDPSLPEGTPASIFQTERYDNAQADPQMLWQFPIATGTPIEIRLYFAELFSGIDAAGERVFDVSVEGEVPTVYDNIDAFGRNGALGAFMLSHTLTMTDDILDIEFVHLGIENPAIKGIEIIDISNVPIGLEPIVTNPGAQVGVEGDSVNLQIEATDANAEACGPLSYTATNLPPNVTIDEETGLISGTLLAGSGSGVAGAFIESEGLVVIEAETDFVDTPGGWNLIEENGTEFLIASTNHFGNTNGQALTYNMEITTPGVYRFHMKSNISGTSTSDENDTWFKVNNTSQVHFFSVQGGNLSGTAEFEDILGGGTTSKTIYYPAGNAQNRSNHGNENPGNSGYFKVYRSGGGGNKWDGQTIDNNGFPIYAYFPEAGTYSIQMSERSAGHKVDRFAFAQIDQVGTGESSDVISQLNGPQSQQNEGGTPGASDDSPYQVTVSVADSCTPQLSTEVSFTWNVTATPIGNPAAFVQVGAGTGLSSSTFNNNSFVIANTGDDNILNVTINTTTGFMRDVVFDPIGKAGDAVPKCLTAGSAGNSAAEVGITVPANGGSDSADCESVFAGPHNGLDDEEGYDILTLDFTDFDPGESFAFGVDMDPTSIKGDLTSGDAGSISGFEFIGATVSIEFASGVVYTTSLFDEGSLGGSDAIVDITSNSLVAPSISVEGSTESRLVTSANQTIQISGLPNASVTLLRVDGRLYIDPGNPSVGYDIDLFEANEAMTKQLYTTQLDASGVANIPVTLTQTPGSGGTPDGGLNHFIAVVNGPGGENSVASNAIVLEYDPDAIIGPSVLLEMTPGADLDASTFGTGSFMITNNSTGALQITNVTIDLSTAVLPDMVWDPTGAGGDASAKCLDVNTGATAVGLVVPTDVCADPFSQPRNGGYDIMSIDFTEFDPTEVFSFAVDIDPNSIQGVAGAGAAGSVSGYELIGATVNVTFSDGTTLVGSIYEDGSLGGGQIVIALDTPETPTISISGVTSDQATVNDLNQTVTVTGTPGDVVSLLVMDSRLFIASNDPPFNVPDVTYYANEAMSGKTLYAGLIGAGGMVDIPVTLLQTQLGNGTPDGGLNQIVAVASDGTYAVNKPVSQTSNVVTLLYDPNAVLNGDLTLNYTLQGPTDYTTDLTVNVYEQGFTTPAYQFTPTGDEAGDALVTGIAPGTYEVAVKSPKYLQVVETVTIVSGTNAIDVGQMMAGDANNDNFVTLLDFSILSGSYNLLPDVAGFDIRADFNGDGFVTIIDFALMSGNFNTGGETVE